MSLICLEKEATKMGESHALPEMKDQVVDLITLAVGVTGAMTDLAVALINPLVVMTAIAMKVTVDTATIIETMETATTMRGTTDLDLVKVGFKPCVSYCSLLMKCIL